MFTCSQDFDKQRPHETYAEVHLEVLIVIPVPRLKQAKLWCHKVFGQQLLQANTLHLDIFILHLCLHTKLLLLESHPLWPDASKTCINNKGKKKVHHLASL